MSDALNAAFDVTRPRSQSEWRVLLADLAGSLSRLLQREVLVVEFRAENDDATFASWGAAADVRVVLARVPRLEAFGTIMVTVNVGEIVMISADLLLFVDGVRLHSPRSGDLYHFGFSADREWTPAGWQLDAAGEWETSSLLPHRPAR
ncbi:MAG: hypothetical protein JNK04_12840 [Myxococcales bacterium]|nr:hypothetical protein [Myxococcales bacterium]